MSIYSKNQWEIVYNPERGIIRISKNNDVNWIEEKFKKTEKKC